jgi:hypothetical protein
METVNPYAMLAVDTDALPGWKLDSDAKRF